MDTGSPNNHTPCCATKKLRNLKKYQCQSTSFRHLLNFKVTIFIDSYYWFFKLKSHRGLSVFHWNLNCIFEICNVEITVEVIDF